MPPAPEGEPLAAEPVEWPPFWSEAPLRFGWAAGATAAAVQAASDPQAAGHRQTVSDPQALGDAAPMAAFERRAYLRAERSRLVADLHRRDGRSHREINSWLNRELGIARVEQATIEQLERSVQRLVRELTRHPPRARPARPVA